MQSGASLGGQASSGTRTGPIQGNTSTTAARRALGVVDYLTLAAIGLVVVLVSLPRLRAFALRENERDAVHMLRLLAGDALRHGEVLRAGGLGALLASNDAHRVRLEDLELVEGGRLRRHGYLFDAREAAPGRWVLRAWPWDHGHTGVGAFQIAPGGALHGHRNADGRLSGPGAPPPALLDPAAAGWVVMRDE
ncbi:MAG: hypothetical protein IPJ77_17795 [Planctomycetes bacterium]|nr:hypothetical protein [Planctomycetota bacterium]